MRPVIILYCFPCLFIQFRSSVSASDKDIRKTHYQSNFCSPEQIPEITFDTTNTLFTNDTFGVYKYVGNNSYPKPFIRLHCKGKRGGIVQWEFYNDPSSNMTPYNRRDSTPYYQDVVDLTYSDFTNLSTYQTTVHFPIYLDKLREFKSMSLACDYVNPSCRMKDYVSVKVEDVTSENTSIRLGHIEKDPEYSIREEEEYNDIIFYIYWNDNVSIKWICAQRGRAVETNISHKCNWYPNCAFSFSNGRHNKKPPRYEILTDEQTCLSLGCSNVYLTNGDTMNIAKLAATLLTCYEGQWAPNWPFMMIVPSLQLYDGLPKFYYSTLNVPLEEFVTVEPLPATVHLNDMIRIIANIRGIARLTARFAYTNTNGSVVVLPGTNSVPASGFATFELTVTMTQDMENVSSVGILLSAWNGTQQVKKFTNVTLQKGLRENQCTLQGPPQITMTPTTNPISNSKLTAVFDTQTVLFDLYCTHFQAVQWLYLNYTDGPIIIATPSGKNILSVKVYSLPKSHSVQFTCKSVPNPCDYSVALIRLISEGRRSLLEIIPYFVNSGPSIVSKPDEPESTINVLYYAVPAATVIVIVVISACVVTIKILKSQLKIQSQHSEYHVPLEEDGAYIQTYRRTGVLDLKVKYSKALNPSWIIPIKNISIDKEAKLGEGEFGVVYRGNLRKISGPVDVAVKVLKENVNRCSSAYNDSTLAEMNVLASVGIGSHANIIQLYGAVIDNYSNGELMVVMEYCAKGCLQNLLRESGDKVISMLSQQSNYCVFEGSYLFSDLLKFSIQMASGMKYLESKKVIHGDLATRNLLVNQDNDLKISDFGLSKQLVNYDIYMKTSQCALPWRWMAPETLTRGRFSVKSDVWAFGVTLWEIFSYADVPFSGLAWTSDFVERLEERHIRLLKPKYASDEIQHVLEKCMNVDFEQRPSFQDVYAEMKIIESNCNQL